MEVDGDYEVPDATMPGVPQQYQEINDMEYISLISYCLLTSYNLGEICFQNCYQANISQFVSF